MAKIYYSLYDRLLHEQRLLRAYAKVRSNKGKAGIDGQSVEDFADHLPEEIAALVRELKDKSYRPKPVRRVEIPKPDGGVRRLGIPTVRDRVVQQALLDILQPIFDPDFHPSSYGYRPGRSAHQAIAKASLFIRRYQRRWVVDMDLSKCFDTLDHDQIIQSIRRRVTDGSILGLIRLFLQSGIMTQDGLASKRTRESPRRGDQSANRQRLPRRLRPAHEKPRASNRPLRGRYPDPVWIKKRGGKRLQRGTKLSGRNPSPEGQRTQEPDRSQQRRRTLSRSHHHEPVHTHTEREGSTVQSQGEADHPAQYTSQSGQGHPRPEPGTAWIHQLLPGSQLPRAVQKTVPLDSPTPASQAADTVEKAATAPPQTPAARLSGRVQGHQNELMAQCRQQPGQLCNAEHLVCKAGTF